MLVTAAENRRHFHESVWVAVFGVLLGLGLGIGVAPAWAILTPLVVGYAWWRHRQVRRRFNVICRPFPVEWEQALLRYVSFFVSLDSAGRERFRSLMKVFLDEVVVTGIRCEVDESTRALVAASAVIPIFGFDDFEYASLGEVLIYPDSFGADFQTDGKASSRNTLGMIGVNHLSGVMILSKPSLFAGFANDGDKRNVGIHEFAHLVDKRDGAVDGVPPTIPAKMIDPWIRWIGEELRSHGPTHIDDYAYTNEAEYFAVLSEYFFERPALLQEKSPQLFAMMQKMYHQNPLKRFGARRIRRRRVGRNAPCPCGSGAKYKRCCRSGGPVTRSP